MVPVDVASSPSHHSRIPLSSDLVFPDAIYLVDAIQSGETVIKACISYQEKEEVCVLLRQCWLYLVGIAHPAWEKLLDLGDLQGIC
ncbi:uncharacterized protein LOC102614097 isoform X3 [Citrus sinensis]|uniref:uncharacterized protein LOC102614097 isoform X3 n=1 Tax=Citrus sinensis TaxID=2711 RepID=UPI00227971A3|nr:uncharacterized protein LOC102614097 isoform X3 [Citrus sinensis]